MQCICGNFVFAWTCSCERICTGGRVGLSAECPALPAAVLSPWCCPPDHGKWSGLRPDRPRWGDCSTKGNNCLPVLHGSCQGQCLRRMRYTAAAGGGKRGSPFLAPGSKGEHLRLLQASEARPGAPALWLDGPEGKKQIPFGNDNKKSKDKNKGATTDALHAADTCACLRGGCVCRLALHAGGWLSLTFFGGSVVRIPLKRSLDGAPISCAAVIKETPRLAGAFRGCELLARFD